MYDSKDKGACTAGVLDLKQAQEWVVTTKLGASDKRPGTQVQPAAVPCSSLLSQTQDLEPQTCFLLTPAVPECLC